MKKSQPHVGTNFMPKYLPTLRVNIYTRGDQKVRGKVLLYHIASIDCNKNSQIENTIYSKLTEIKIWKM